MSPLYFEIMFKKMFNDRRVIRMTRNLLEILMRDDF